MKTSTFLILSTSVLMGVLDISSALPPPPVDPIRIPDVESPDIVDPPPLPHPQEPPLTGGFYELPNGTRIAVVVRPPGFGENPKDRGGKPAVLAPPPFPGDAVDDEDGVKHTLLSHPLVVSSDRRYQEELPESESPLPPLDVTGEDPSQVYKKRNG